MNNFLSGFGDELAKIAARRGVKIIRDLVARGDISKADRLAKTKGVIAPSRAESFIPKVDGTKVKWTERGHLGSEIRHLGEPGQENLATLVADPIHGIAARKIRHGNSTVPKAMRGHTGAVANDPSMKGLIARRLGDVRHELSGRHVSFDEYVSGHNAQKFLNTASQADQVAIGRVVSGLEQTVKRRAKAMGYVVDDINAKNVIVNKNASGRWTGKVLDGQGDRLYGGAGQESSGVPCGTVKPSCAQHNPAEDFQPRGRVCCVREQAAKRDRGREQAAAQGGSKTLCQASGIGQRDEVLTLKKRRGSNPHRSSTAIA